MTLLKTSGLAYSIFYPSTFMETLLGPQQLGPLVLVLGTSSVRPWFIAAHDYGRQVVTALQLAQPGQPQEYVIQGPEPVDQLAAAQRLVAAYAPARLHVVTVPPGLLRLGGLVAQQADYGVHIAEALNRYPEQFKAERTWRDLGRPTTMIEASACQQTSFTTLITY